MYTVPCQFLILTYKTPIQGPFNDHPHLITFNTADFDIIKLGKSC